MKSSLLRWASLAVTCTTLLGCGGVAALAGANAPKAETKGAVAANAMVMGASDRGIVLGRVLEDNGATLVVDWSGTKATVARDAVSPAVAFGSLHANDRVAASASDVDLLAQVGTVLRASGASVRIKWDDGTESDVVSGRVAKLIASLCQRERGCKFGADSVGDSAALPGVKVGDQVAVNHTIKGASYWSVGEVLELQPDGVLANVRGTGHVSVKSADIRLPSTKAELVPKAKVLFGKPPGGLAAGYVVRVTGDEAEMSFSEDAESGTPSKIGTEIFKAP